ncbi:MAG TPA: hypothetical protein PLS10_14320 [Chitinophagales bacterium]|nr:hypothetical protein [Chitinophagales bacterium]
MEEIYSIKDNHLSELNSIFEDENSFGHFNFYKLRYQSIDKIEKNNLLFIGINPSNIDDIKQDSDFYNLSQDNNTYKKFFSKFEDVSKYVKLKWSHLDLLFFRNTNQNDIDYILHRNTKNGVDFIRKQLDISKRILENIQPKIIVVSNAKARLFLGLDKSKNKKGEDINVWMGYDFKFDDSIGTYRITNENSKLRNTPIFFTSMLSGQAALDKGSYERLKWHIKFVNDKISNLNS